MPFIEETNVQSGVSVPTKFHSNPVTSKLIRSAFFKNDYNIIVKLLAEKLTKEELENNPQLHKFLKSKSHELTTAAIAQGYPEVMAITEKKLNRRQLFDLRESYNNRTSKTMDEGTLINNFNLNIEAGAPQKFHSNSVTSKLIRSAFLKENYEEAVKLIAKNITQEELDNNQPLRSFLQSKSDKLVNAAIHLDSLEVSERLKICLTEEQCKRLDYEIDSKYLASEALKSPVNNLRSTLAQAQENGSEAAKRSRARRKLNEAVTYNEQPKASRKLNEAVAYNMQEQHSIEVSVHLETQTRNIPPIELPEKSLNGDHSIILPPVITRENKVSRKMLAIKAAFSMDEGKAPLDHNNLALPLIHSSKIPRKLR